MKKQRNKMEEVNREQKEMEECTFKPNVGINKKAPAKMTDKVPRGYYE